VWDINIDINVWYIAVVVFGIVFGKSYITIKNKLSKKKIGF